MQFVCYCRSDVFGLLQFVISSLFHTYMQPALPFSGKDMDTLVEIGQGVRGRVFRMTHKPSGRVIAAKVCGWVMYIVEM